MGGRKLIVQLTPEENKLFSAKEMGVKYVKEKSTPDFMYVMISHPRFASIGEGELIPTISLMALDTLLRTFNETPG